MSDVTRILARVEQGDSKAAEELLPLVYEELRRLAAHKMANEAAGQTLQPTALVNEAYLRLVGDQARDWQNRAHFIGVAASVMRRLLIDHARRKQAEKRHLPEPHEWGGGMTPNEAEELLNLNLALQRLEKSNARYARVVEIRYFGGLSIEETAEVMQTSPNTVKRDWTAARAWLKQQIQPTKGHSGACEN